MSDFDRIYRLVKAGEGMSLDFKRSVSDAVKIARTLAAFANSEGGTLVIGVDDQGELRGIDPAQERHVLLRAAKRFVQPPVYLHFEVLRARSKSVLLVGIDADPKIERRAPDEHGEGVPYVRVGDQTLINPAYAQTRDAEKRNRDPIPILMDRHPDLLGYLDANDSVTVAEYMRLMNISYGVANRSLESLVSQGVLEREEAGGRSRYFLPL